MNAKVTTLHHYRDVESTAREIAKARATIDELRFALHSTIRQLSALSAAISIERVKCVDVMDQAHAVLLSTLPGGLDALDEMKPAERKDELLEAIKEIAWIGAGRPPL